MQFFAWTLSKNRLKQLSRACDTAHQFERLLFATALATPGVSLDVPNGGRLVKELPTHAEHDDGTATVGFIEKRWPRDCHHPR